MIERSWNDEYRVECDGCGDEFFVETEEWKEVLDELKEREWKYRNNAGDWEHYCPDCVQRERSEGKKTVSDQLP